METKNIILLVVTAAISFAVGRVIMYVRKKNRRTRDEALRSRAVQALRDAPPGPPARNKSKRRRESRASQP